MATNYSKLINSFVFLFIAFLAGDKKVKTEIQGKPRSTRNGFIGIYDGNVAGEGGMSNKLPVIVTDSGVESNIIIKKVVEAQRELAEKG